ncbi:MAG: ABC transporter permease [Acidobacteriota bacterium]
MWMRRELMVAWRTLARSPGFALVVVTTFALGIAGTTAIFSLVRGVLLRDLPFPRAQQLAMVWETAPDGRNERNPVNAGNYLRWRERSRSFSSLSVMVPWTATLSTANGEPQRLKIGYVSGEFFDTLGLKPSLGRGFLAEEGTQGHDAVVVLSHALWRSHFGGDPTVVGRDLMLDGERVRVVGVASPQADVPPGTEVWNPIGFGARHRDARGRAYGVVGRLRDGVSVEAAQAEMDTMALDLARERPEVDTGWGVRVVPLREQLVGEFRLGLWALLGAVGALLLLACANLANLWLARAAAKQREFAVRSALGGGALELSRVPLWEAALLAATGGALGVIGAPIVLDALLRAAPTDIPNFLDVRVDGAAMAFAVSATVLVTALVAAIPAWRASRSSAAALLSGGRGGTRDGRARRLFVTAQTGIACALLVVSGLLARSLVRLQHVDTGLASDGVRVTQIDLPSATYGEPARIDQFFSNLTERLRAVPGVQSVGAISWLPLGGPGSATTFRRADVAPFERGHEPVAEVRVTLPGVFSTLGVPLLAGRDVGREDSATAPRRVVVSAALAHDLFPDRDALGGELVVSWGPEVSGWRCTIVGVVGDVRLTGLATPARYAMYFPSAQSPANFMTVAMRSSLSSAALAAAVRQATRDLDPQIADSALRELDAVGDEALRQPRLLTFLLATFAGAALALAALGVYGVLAQGVMERRREIGIRLAVGARALDVAGMVLRDGMRPALAGTALGLGSAALAVGALRGLLYEVPPSDPFSWAAAAGVLMLVAAGACALPALRASRLQPSAVLRED